MKHIGNGERILGDIVLDDGHTDGKKVSRGDLCLK